MEKTIKVHQFGLINAQDVIAKADELYSNKDFDGLKDLIRQYPQYENSIMFALAMIRQGDVYREETEL